MDTPTSSCGCQPFYYKPGSAKRRVCARVRARVHRWGPPRGTPKAQGRECARESGAESQAPARVHRIHWAVPPSPPAHGTRHPPERLQAVLPQPAPLTAADSPALPPLCDIPSGCCSFTGPWTVTLSSLRMLRRVAACCRPLRPVLLLVSFPRSRSPVVGVLGLC